MLFCRRQKGKYLDYSPDLGADFQVLLITLFFITNGFLVSSQHL